MANSVTITRGPVSLLGKGEGGVNRYKIVLVMDYNEVTTTTIQVQNPEWAEDQLDPNDPPQFIDEDVITVDKLFGGNYAIECIHDADDLTEKMLGARDRMKADITAYKAETSLASNAVLASKIAQLEGMMNA